MRHARSCTCGSAGRRPVGRRGRPGPDHREERRSTCRATRPPAARPSRACASAGSSTDSSTPTSRTPSWSRTSSPEPVTPPANTRRTNKAAGLLGCHHRARQGRRHQRLLRHLVRYPGQPQRQGSDRRHHGSRQRRSGHRQALRADVPHRHHPRLRQRAEGAGREPRHQAIARGDGCVDGCASGLRVGLRVSADGRQGHSCDRRRRIRRLSGRLAGRVGRTHSPSIPTGTTATTTVATGAARWARRGAEDGDAACAALGLGEQPGAGPQLGRGRQGSGRLPRRTASMPSRPRWMVPARPVRSSPTPTISSISPRPTSCSSLAGLRCQRG